MGKVLALVLAAATALSLMAASGPVPFEQVTNATGIDSSYLYIFEQGKANDGRVYGDKAPVYKVDTGNISDLNTFSVGIFAGCDLGANDWDNCITTVEWHIKAGSCVKFFTGTGYGGSLVIQAGSRTTDFLGTSYWEGTSKNNVTSSIKWGDWKYVPSSSGYQCVLGSY